MNSTLSFIDFQPYLLPDTDAWALPEDKAVLLLDYLKTRGMDSFYCVPPIRQGGGKNSIDFLQNVFLAFLKKHSAKAKFRLAARYRLDEGFISLLRKNGLLTIGRHILVDVSPLEKNEYIWETLKAISRAGYTPIIMQPERTTYWQEEDFRRLRGEGARLMLNLYSLFGYNGDEALMYSRWMLSEGMYDYVCSGMEDTKIMRYSERFALDEDDAMIKELGHLEENGRLLWMNEL